MAFMKDEELGKIVARLVGSKNPNKITVVKVVEGNGIRRYFFYKKKGVDEVKIRKAGRKVGKKLVAASPLGPLGGVLASARPTQILADLNDVYANAVAKAAEHPSGAKQDLMHVLKSNAGIRFFGILDHIGQMSYGLWIGTLEESGPWLQFLGHMDSEGSPNKINYHLTGELFRGPRVLFNNHKREHQSY